MFLDARPVFRFSYLLLVLGLLTAGLLVLPEPARADHLNCPPASTEALLAAWDSCRNFVMDPGQSQLMDRADLIQAANTYTSGVGGFSMNFLWYSFERTITVSSPDVRWSSCRPFVHPGPGNHCPPEDIVSDFRGGIPHRPGSGGVLDTMDHVPAADLSVFEFGGAWIAKVCGNWLETPDRPKPVPTIAIDKFRDDNQDGTRNGSEPPLKGWSFEIKPIELHYGGSSNPVTVTTDESGRAIFTLDGYGPGRYEIKELAQSGWESTDGAVKTVNVEAGQGSKEYSVSFGNRQVADVEKVSMTFVDLPVEMMVGQPADLSVEVTVANRGPASPVGVEDSLAIGLPSDCLSEAPVQTQLTDLNSGATRTLRFVYSVTCSLPSFHDFTFTDSLRTTAPWVHDPDPRNNLMTDSALVPVIAETDLALTSPRLICDRSGAGQPYRCHLTASAVNEGAFGPVDATVELEFAASNECSVAGGPTSLALPGLAVGESAEIKAQWTATCSPDSPVRSFAANLSVTADDIHVRDTDSSNNVARVAHTDSDIKPNSDPNSINMKRKGVTAVAILATDTFDSIADVLPSSINFGRTGIEAPALRCSAEDANADGRVDLICHFEVSETGFLAGDTQGILTAELRDGSRLFSTDSVRILHA